MVPREVGAMFVTHNRLDVFHLSIYIYVYFIYSYRQHNIKEDVYCAPSPVS